MKQNRVKLRILKLQLQLTFAISEKIICRNNQTAETPNASKKVPSTFSVQYLSVGR